MDSSVIEVLMSLGQEQNMNQGSRKRNASLIGLPPRVPTKVPLMDLSETQPRGRRRLAKDTKVVVASVVEEGKPLEDSKPSKPLEDSKPSKPLEDVKVFSQEEQDKYTMTNKLVLSNFETSASRLLETKPVILVEYHIDHLNHVMVWYAGKPDGYIILVEAVHLPKIGDQESFKEYALLVKQKEGKWELLFKRCTSNKIYWDAQCLRELCYQIEVVRNTMGGSANFDIFLSRMHLENVKKYLMIKPDGFKVLIRTILLVASDENKKVHRMMWKEGDKFHAKEVEVDVENNDIFWNTVFTVNMFMSKITRK